MTGPVIVREMLPISLAEVLPYAQNARTHSPAQIDQIAASISEFGFVNPILIGPNGALVAGHGRVLAARKLGMEVVPYIRLGHLTSLQARMLRIADNRIALNAGWDEDLLGAELRAIAAEDGDLDLLAFGDRELSALLAANNDGLTDPDAVPDVPAVPVSVLGDVWIMGRHRLACGDSTEAAVVSRVLAGVTPHLMVTDPPYGVEYSAGWRNEAMPAKNDPNRWKDGAGRATGKVKNDDRADWREAWMLFPGDVAYVWHAGLFAPVVTDSLHAAGFQMRSQIIWAKSNFAIGRGHYHWQHEACLYAVRKGGTGHWVGDRKQATVWQIDKPAKSETGHGTQKPVECMKRPIENNSSHGQAIYEPFSGSGTTLIAAEMTGRSCHAIELDPGYVDVAALRWMAFSGQQATLEGDGRTFAQVAAERLPAPGAALAAV